MDPMGLPVHIVQLVVNNVMCMRNTKHLSLGQTEIRNV